MGLQTALDGVRQAETVVDALRLADDFAIEARNDPGVRTLRIVEHALAGEDDLAAIAATHALAGMLDVEAGRMLGRLLSDERRFLREHAAWALASGLPRFEAIGRLLGMVVEGGFGGMLAQRTLEEWSDVAPAAIAVGVESALLGVHAADARARLIETLGLVDDPIVATPLRRAASDPAEPEIVRVAAVAALGDREETPDVAELLEVLAEGDGDVGGVARVALVDLRARTRRPTWRSSEGLTVMQLFLHADIDPRLASVGAGDNGGIATLLVRLGDALVSEPATGVDRVITVSRGSVGDAMGGLDALRSDGGGHAYGRVPLLRDAVASAAAWPLRVAARRGIRRIVRAAGRIDLMHLRMADVGTLAAADVARESGIPVVFTLAPDPHAVIDSLDRAGRLPRTEFGRADLVEHYWFRARLVQRLAANAAHTVLFPRPQLDADLRRLVGIDMSAHPDRHTIVPEGIDLITVDRALEDAAGMAQGAEPVPALRELRKLLDGLSTERKGLPLVITVGRVHRVKGVATLVDAWANGPLADQANLLVVGGDLEAPSSDEREQLDRIDTIVAPAERARRGLLLAGHRPNDVAARWLAAARFGVPGLAAPGGVYACASLKEEFGIALLEAMASGLFVVAPDGGGPATYVEHGRTGLLTATWDHERLSETLEEALTIAAADAAPDATTGEVGIRAARARAMVRSQFTVQRTAEVLGEVYAVVAREEAALFEMSESAH